MRVNRFVVYGWSTYTKGIMDARKKEKIIRLFEEHQYLASDA